MELRPGKLREVDVVEGEVEEERLAVLDGVRDEGLGPLRHPGGETGEVDRLLHYLLTRVERTGAGEGVGGDGVTVSAWITVGRSEGTHIVTVGQPEVLRETLNMNILTLLVMLGEDQEDDGGEPHGDWKEVLTVSVF